MQVKSRSVPVSISQSKIYSHWSLASSLFICLRPAIDGLVGKCDMELDRPWQPSIVLPGACPLALARVPWQRLFQVHFPASMLLSNGVLIMQRAPAPSSFPCTVSCWSCLSSCDFYSFFVIIVSRERIDKRTERESDHWRHLRETATQHPEFRDLQNRIIESK